MQGVVGRSGTLDTMAGTVVFISALQRHTAFHDDLLRKIAGETLIQRAISKARQMGISDSKINVYTDAETVALTAERAGVLTYLDIDLSKRQLDNEKQFLKYLLDAVGTADMLVRISPYYPMLSLDTLTDANNLVSEGQIEAIIGVCQLQHDDVTTVSLSILEEFLSLDTKDRSNQSSAYVVLPTHLVRHGIQMPITATVQALGEDTFELQSARDWWVCEKLLQRKRIVFRVIGSDRVGLGHIYRALSLAHEITDHEVIFVTDSNNQAAVKKLTRDENQVEVFKPNMVISEILRLEPNLVINDMLDTELSEVQLLQEHGIRVINFEDLGGGAQAADLTINELYDVPQYPGQNTCWGNQYFFVRDEFTDASPCNFSDQLDALLLAFGGIDQHDLTRKILFSIIDVCKSRNVHVYVVTGPGYAAYQELKNYIDQTNGISLTHATGVISTIMEKVSLAITSNGRTVYEMAHMNIPAIVIPQHEREKTHDFAREENGFIQLEPYKKNVTEEDTRKVLKQLLDTPSYRKNLYQNTTRFRFDRNKQRVIELINQQLQQC